MLLKPVDYSMEPPCRPEDCPQDARSPSELPIENLPDLNITVSSHEGNPSQSHVQSPDSPMIEDAPPLEVGSFFAMNIAHDRDDVKYRGYEPQEEYIFQEGSLHELSSTAVGL